MAKKQPTGFYDPNTGKIVQYTKPKRKAWPWIVAVVVIIAGIYGAGSKNDTVPDRETSAIETEDSNIFLLKSTADPETVPSEEASTIGEAQDIELKTDQEPTKSEPEPELEPEPGPEPEPELEPEPEPEPAPAVLTLEIDETPNEPVTRSGGTGPDDPYWLQYTYEKDSVIENPIGEVYAVNTNTHKLHRMTCKDVEKIKPENYTETENPDEYLAAGYSWCKKCHG